MSKIFLTVALAATAISFPTSAQAVEPTVEAPSSQSLKLAREIVSRGFPEDQRLEIFSTSVDAMVAQLQEAMNDDTFADNPELQAKLEVQQGKMIEEMKGIIASHIPELMEGWAQAYAAEFNDKELRDILAFVSTDSGQAFFTRNTTLVNSPQFKAATAPYMYDIMQSSKKWQGIFMQTVMDSM
ncbi:DUF2059 domain-containing protein [Altererythrobacter indicus]|uniref:DUF2059 domain-containing protein n=1 Tax=Altericroceibacterium indicum TaxID=374177 RepID=A0A845A765_9SPHN|nr:DUF2059 domain-containing protein [Altericroceibacterium indicum]MXP25103.1 DUF2059 domain-containing protein [Altericroceibacterium indicum]